MDDILAKMREGGFKPKANVDEDFPVIVGEYRCDVKAIKPWTAKGAEKAEKYVLELRITETLAGDKADGRNFSRFYPFAGMVRDGWKDGKAIERPINKDDIAKSLTDLCNDVYTLDGAPTLDMSSTEAFEGGFAKLIGTVGYIRAWKFSPKDEPDKHIQQWILKSQKDLRKDAKGGATKPTVPF